ncbi:hypothetical protein HJC23_000763 [Cyclotella cryptica]|uniref:AAA+ ATPase domain-containing protein n=1 Tax=Cyclotella cryptica TaxID=29204 RepID=A0ABD3Q161_9STRA
MVRYSAPPQADTATPMEWTAIPDDHDDDDDHSDNDGSYSTHISSSHSQHRSHRNAIGSLVLYENPRDSDVDWSNDGNGDLPTDSREGANNDHCTNQSSLPPMPSSQEWYHHVQAMYEGYLCNMDREYFMQQQYARRRRRRRRFVAFVTILAIIVLVLYRYAPPPPPVKIVLPTSLVKESKGVSSPTEFDASLATKLDSDSQSREDGTQQRQYDSWGKYSRHTLELFTDAFVHQLSVLWYALSNAFLYAADEVRLVLVDFVRRGMQTRSTPSSPADQTEKDIARQRKHHVFTTTECPIRLPAATNRRISLPRGANHASIRDGVRLWHGFSTEEFLRQSIGASLSPQNLALTLLAEGIDSWGQSLVESASVELVHRMSAAMETGYWIQDGKDGDYSISQWILPPALGLLLVGPEGVGKLHTARLLGRWLFGHCDGMEEERDGEVDLVGAVCAMSSMEESHQYCSNDLGHINARSRQRDIQSIQEQPNGILEIMAEEYVIQKNNDSTHSSKDHPIKEMIVNHIIQRQHTGSVIITHHMEVLPLSLLTELSSIINGKSQYVSYTTPNGDEVSACTNGTVFVFTSKQWGTKSIFEEIQKNGMRVKSLRRESLLSSVRWEVDSHLEYWGRMANVSRPDLCVNCAFIARLTHPEVDSALCQCPPFFVNHKAIDGRTLFTLPTRRSQIDTPE